MNNKLQSPVNEGINPKNTSNKVVQWIKDNKALIIFFLLTTLIRELAAFFNWIDPQLYPPPSRVYNAFLHVWKKSPPSLVNHLIASLYHVLLGYTVGVSLGVLTGLCMALNKYIHKFFNPILMVLIPVPTLAWVPVLILVYGFTNVTVVIAIALACYFPLAYNTLNGIRSTKKEYIWAARIMGANRMELFYKVLVPSAFSSIISGMRLAIGYSWRAMVGAEMLAAMDVGIGVMMNSAQFSFRVDILFAGLVIIGVGGMLADHLVLGELEKHTIEKWGVVRNE